MSKRSRLVSGAACATPLGLVGSRLVACPICGRSVHLLLAASHVESHFSDAPGEVQAEAQTSAAEEEQAVETHGSEPPDAQPSIKAVEKEPLEKAEEAFHGGALAPPPPHVEGSSAYVPGSDAVWKAFRLQVMSGDFTSCGLCLELFEPGIRDRFVLWPCQHARQCGACALRVWTQPKAKRRCPWCKGKLDIRPRAFRPFM